MLKESTTKRNNEIEIFRFLFICAISLMHFSNSYFKSTPYFSNAYIGTEFFFLISGFMIMKSADSHQMSAFTFTGQRVKKLYPHYLFAFLLLFLLSAFTSNTGILPQLRSLFTYAFELLFLQASGLKCFGLLNYPAWYVSALLIAGFFIYALIRLHKKLYLTIIAPLAVIATYSFFSANIGSLDLWGGNQFLNLSDAVTRGFAAMSLGTLSYELSKYICEKHYTPKKLLRILLSLAELTCFIGVLIGCVLLKDSTYDFHMLLIMFFAITLAFSGLTYTSCLFSCPIFSYLGKISYPMYVYQLFIICLFCLYLPELSYSTGILAFLVALIVFSSMIDIVYKYLMKKLVKRS